MRNSQWELTKDRSGCRILLTLLIIFFNILGNPMNKPIPIDNKIILIINKSLKFNFGKCIFNNSAINTKPDGKC